MAANDRFLLKPGQTWIALGDSITHNPEGYVPFCEKALRPHVEDITVINAGVGGNKARDMVARFERDVLSRSPNLVSVSVGVNDVWHGFYDFEANRELEDFDPRYGETLSDYRNDLQWMAARLGEQQITTVFLSPTMIGENPETKENQLLKMYIEAMREVANEHNAVYCPMNEFLWHQLLKFRSTLPEMRFTTDGVHMTEMGTHMMAAALLISFAQGHNFPPLDLI